VRVLSSPTLRKREGAGFGGSEWGVAPIIQGSSGREGGGIGQVFVNNSWKDFGSKSRKKSVFCDNTWVTDASWLLLSTFLLCLLDDDGV